jgi:hypothetical protein
MKNKHIRTYNTKGEYHGYQEWYWKSDVVYYRGKYKNNTPLGYVEYHGDNKQTTYYHII